MLSAATWADDMSLTCLVLRATICEVLRFATCAVVIVLICVPANRDAS